MSKPKNADDYIALQDNETVEMLEKLRQLIRLAAPEAEEHFSYGVVCYKLQGHLVGFGAQKKGISFYTMNVTLPTQFKSELTGYTYKSSTIHINKGQKMPSTVLKKMIQTRIKENRQKELERQKKISKKNGVQTPALNKRIYQCPGVSEKGR